LNNDYFAILYKLNNKIFVKCFASDGKQIRDSILIHSNLDGSRKSPTFAVGKNKIFFSWSDTRNIANGYDIYCSIFNLSDLTDIENIIGVAEVNSFKLFQNYPNPFNPSTKIKYATPLLGGARGGLIILKVYDILGNEVATLVNEYKPVGSYEVEFSARGGLASGIYYYQLRAGEFVQTRKMVLLR